MFFTLQVAKVLWSSWYKIVYQVDVGFRKDSPERRICDQVTEEPAETLFKDHQRVSDEEGQVPGTILILNNDNFELLTW